MQLPLEENSAFQGTEESDLVEVIISMKVLYFMIQYLSSYGGNNFCPQMFIRFRVASFQPLKVSNGFICSV